MHQQISGSPSDTKDNIRRIVTALAARNVNIEAIGPAFDSPHVRIAVKHNEPYDPTDENDAFNQALAAMEEAGLAPEIKPSVVVDIPNRPGTLQAALGRLTREGYVPESILVLAGDCKDGIARISFGVGRTMIADWDQESDRLERAILESM
jgi:hypothetical protein